MFSAIIVAMESAGPGILESIGLGVRNKARDFVYFAAYVAVVLKESLLYFRHIRSRKAGSRVLVMQLLFTGFEALGIITILALALGAVIILVGYALLPQFGQGKVMYALLVIVITREMGPVLIAFILIARSGTAIATELGTMVVSHEIEAYLAFGISPIEYLVVPRFMGLVISMLVLDIYFSIFGLLGSWLIASVAFPIPFGEYGRNLLGVLGVHDIAVSLVKSLAFGVIIALTSTFSGFSVKNASTEIPQAGIKAVGNCFVWCILVGALISVLSYL